MLCKGHLLSKKNNKESSLSWSYRDLLRFREGNHVEFGEGVVRLTGISYIIITEVKTGKAPTPTSLS